MTSIFDMSTLQKLAEIPIKKKSGHLGSTEKKT